MEQAQSENGAAGDGRADAGRREALLSLAARRPAGPAEELREVNAELAQLDPRYDAAEHEVTAGRARHLSALLGLVEGRGPLP